MSGARQSGLVERIVTYPVVRDGVAFQTNPTAGTVVADSGALGNDEGGLGTYEVTAIVSATATARLTFQHRNAANDGNVGDTHDFICGENNTVALPFRVGTTALNERVRVVMETTLSGDLAATVIAQRVG